MFPSSDCYRSIGPGPCVVELSYKLFGLSLIIKILLIYAFDWNLGFFEPTGLIVMLILQPEGSETEL